MELSKIIKHIRRSAGLSQEEFADKVGVTRITVTRWEASVSVPNVIAQIKMYEIAKENGTDFFDMIISNIPEHRTDGDKIILYHGSKTGIVGPIRPISREFCDFGRGFYMGTEAHQPLTMLFSSDKNVVSDVCLYIVEFDMRDLKVMHVPFGIDWALLIAYCRGMMEDFKGTDQYEKYRSMLTGYDVVVGKIADDKIFTTIDTFFDGYLTEKAVLECLSALPLGDQYVALTDNACNRVRILERIDLSELERLCITEVSERNRKIGMKMAEDIHIAHRRKGRFIDEIMMEKEEDPEDNRRAGKYFDEIMKEGG